MTGNRLAHPLLISLANIKMATRNKSSNHLFLLLALLPIPHFTHHNKKIRGVLDSRLFHQCLDIVLKPLKVAAEIGIMMSDPLGWRRFCYPSIAAHIVDTPESALISGVAGKTSSVTTAWYKHFGDNFRHPARTASITIAQLTALESNTHPWDLEAYIPKAKELRLNGVHRPFWRDFPLSDPSTFLTSEPLHHWHKQFWDHDAKWCIHALTGPELDFRFSVLHPHTAFRHFKEGISTLKQVTGREHRDVQRYIVAIIADAVHPKFLIAIRALNDFRYLAQSTYISEDTCDQIKNALQEFHSHKQAILDAGARRGRKNPIDNWYIPKLEFLQSVVPGIRLNGISAQWSADTTEHAHIEVIKNPAHSGNNQNYEPQICRHLDRSDKLRQFDLATALRDAKLDFRAAPSADPEAFFDDDADTDNYNIDTTFDLLANVDSVSPLIGTTRTLVDYFQLSSQLKSGLIPSAYLPYRTQRCSPHSAFHLTRDAKYKRMSIEDIGKLFNLPDLHSALGDYLHHLSHGETAFSVGGRRISSETCNLPFTELDVWDRVRVQTKSYHYPHEILPAHTINAYPPSFAWPLGHYDTVIVNTDDEHQWPKSGLTGMCFSNPSHYCFNNTNILRTFGRRPSFNISDCSKAYNIREFPHS